MGDLAPTTDEINMRCTSVARGNRPSEWARAVEQIWKGLNSSENDMLDMLYVREYWWVQVRENSVCHYS